MMNSMKAWFEGFTDAEIWEEMQLQYMTYYGYNYLIPANHGFSKEVCIQGVRK